MINPKVYAIKKGDAWWDYESDSWDNEVPLFEGESFIDMAKLSSSPPDSNNLDGGEVVVFELLPDGTFRELHDLLYEEAEELRKQVEYAEELEAWIEQAKKLLDFVWFEYNLDKNYDVPAIDQFKSLLDSAPGKKIRMGIEVGEDKNGY